MAKDKIRDKFEGALVGSAIGDAFGYPLMGMSFEEICERFEKNGAMELPISSQTDRAMFTEATQMNLFTADGIIWANIENAAFENASLAKYVFFSYQLWLYMQTKTVAGKEYAWLFDKKENPNLSSLIRVKGLAKNRRLFDTNLNALLDARNNMYGTLTRHTNDNTDNCAVKRVLCAGLYYAENSDMAFRMACDIGAITHPNPDGYLPCGVYAAMVAEILNGAAPDDALVSAMALLAAYPGHENCYNALQQVIDLVGDEDEDPQDCVAKLGKGVEAVEALAIAVYSALIHQRNFKFAIELAANHDGDSAACAAITGGLLGVFYGYDALPKDWKSKIQLGALLLTVSDTLYEDSPLCGEA